MQPSLASLVCTALMRIGTHMATGFDQHFAEQKMTQAQFRMLLSTWLEGRHEGVTPSRLADHMLVERATVSALSRVLVERGWLKRIAGENRRSHRLVLTPAGGRQLEQLAPLAVQLAEDTLADLSKAQLKALLESLDLIESRLRSHKAGEHELEKRVKS